MKQEIHIRYLSLSKDSDGTIAVFGCVKFVNLRCVFLEKKNKCEPSFVYFVEVATF